MFEQVQLDYSFSALEPYIDATTMETHYTKHHATYTKNLNDALEKANLKNQTIEEIFISLDKMEDHSLKTTLINNGGGYYNHNLYFSTLSGKGNNKPIGVLKEKIESAFGDYTTVKEKLTTCAIRQFGSGWAWLSKNNTGELQISATANQNNPYIETQGEWTPIFGIDVWEHAYYLKYKNLRADYINALFEVADWEKILARYTRK